MRNRLLSSVCGLFLLSLGANAATPPVPPLQANELHFISANAEFTLLHEMGHLLINELQLPVLGSEEDAADQLGFMGLFLFATNTATAILRQVTDMPITGAWR
jgi:uncharacterized membrane protein YgdD (TMEM256/DUF423 family)